jgi:hypothetical protein
MAGKAKKFDLRDHYKRYIGSRWRQAPFLLRITEWKDYPVPVLVVKERYDISKQDNPIHRAKPSARLPNEEKRGNLVERGHVAGSSQRRCLPVLHRIVEKVRDDSGVPLDLQRYLTREGLKLRLNLPLDEEAGAKLALIFRLQERVTDLERVELIARRVARFTREEAVYWFSRTTSYGSDANRWAISGLRTMLGGQPKDQGVARMLEQLRSNPRASL